MEPMVQSLSCLARKSPSPTHIRTTLYDLIAALSEEIGPDEEHVLMATVVHFLNTHRVSYTGDLWGYRLVCDEAEYSTWSEQKDKDLSAMNRS